MAALAALAGLAGLLMGLLTDNNRYILNCRTSITEGVGAIINTQDNTNNNRINERRNVFNSNERKWQGANRTSSVY